MTALITGASSGIGYELARRFGQDAYDLILVARDRQKLEQLAQDVQSHYGVTTKVIVRDLVDSQAPEEILREVEQASLQVDILVNNAGTQVYGLFAEADLPKLLAMIQVNLTTLTHLTRLFLPGMLERGRGKILNLGSTGSFAPGPLNAVYCATKAYVLSFSEAIAAELDGTGVTVTALCPGATDTPFVMRHGMADVRLFKSTMSAFQVAEIGYRALMRGQRVAVAGRSNQLQVLAFRLLGPFMPLIPNSILKRMGMFVMGRTS
jgi:hypothetical protein